MKPITVELPLRIESTPNQRLHWAAKAKKTKAHREAVDWALRGIKPPAAPARITLTRIAPRVLDSDNLAAGFKAARDSVAQWLGIDDGSPLLIWSYAQERGAPKAYGVRIGVEAA